MTNFIYRAPVSSFLFSSIHIQKTSKNHLTKTNEIKHSLVQLYASVSSNIEKIAAVASSCHQKHTYNMEWVRAPYMFQKLALGIPQLHQICYLYELLSENVSVCYFRAGLLTLFVVIGLGHLVFICGPGLHRKRQKNLFPTLLYELYFLSSRDEQKLSSKQTEKCEAVTKKKCSASKPV